jgi:hypothetical protein
MGEPKNRFSAVFSVREPKKNDFRPFFRVGHDSKPGALLATLPAVLHARGVVLGIFGKEKKNQIRTHDQPT